jgi:hypothetical protein
MSINNKLGALAAMLILIPSSLYPAFGDTKHKRYRTHAQRAHVAREAAPSLRRIVGGDYVDREGWRYRPGSGWDNTCFHLDYLDSQFACNGGSGRR